MKTSAIPATLLAFSLAVPAWADSEDESRWNTLCLGSSRTNIDP